MSIAYTMMPGRGDMDALLARFADDLIAQDVSVAGVVQINVECAPDRPCDMDLRLLPDAGRLRISQTLGPGARGCRLDPDALEQAVALTLSQLDKAQMLIINKFGKHEALGRGFRPVIAEAVSLGIPVICGVNGLNEQAFQDFAGGMAQSLPAEAQALQKWALGAITPSS